ncbi:MAG: TonB-dependent receptor plug domain-containing protein, partial [Gemmatimonadaceae bacterium]
PQLLQGIPGVRVRLSSSQWMIRSQRCTGRSLPGLSAAGQEPVVLIDGQPATVEQLGTIKVHEIEALEVYQGSSQMPAEVRGRGCFAILVWLGTQP